MSLSVRLLNAVCATALVIFIGCGVCLSYVAPNESVVRDCDGDLSVWRAPEDGGFKWDGLCRTATYEDDDYVGFREEVSVEGQVVTLRGHYVVHFPQDADDIASIHRIYHGDSRAALREIGSDVMTEILAVAQDPSWRHLSGGVIRRSAKEALEYGVHRLSPTGDIWLSPESKRALGAAIQGRLDGHLWPPGVSVTVRLGFVTER